MQMNNGDIGDYLLVSQFSLILTVVSKKLM